MANITIHFVPEMYDYGISVVNTDMKSLSVLNNTEMETLSVLNNTEMETLSVLNTAFRAEMGRILNIKYRTCSL